MLLIQNDALDLFYVCDVHTGWRTMQFYYDLHGTSAF